MADLRAARSAGRKFAMLTCYDFTTARLMQESGVPGLLVGDSAASVILGHANTLPAKLGFMIELTAAVRRGAPLAMVWADMPFGSYQRSTAQGVRNVCRMVQLSGADAVKIESAATQIPLVKRLADAGVAVVAHLGLRPQFIGRLGEYKTQGRSATDAMKVVELSQRFAEAGAAAILLEAVPPEVSAAVVAEVDVPVIGCGAGPACHGHVFVTHDALRLTARKPRFVPDLGDLSAPAKEAFERYVRLITDRAYPAAEHEYEMPADERALFVGHKRTSGGV